MLSFKSVISTVNSYVFFVFVHNCVSMNLPFHKNSILMTCSKGFFHCSARWLLERFMCSGDWNYYASVWMSNLSFSSTSWAISTMQKWMKNFPRNRCINKQLNSASSPPHFKPKNAISISTTLSIMIVCLSNLSVNQETLLYWDRNTIFMLAYM